MKYPGILILPVLMFLDYYLTLWGFILREKQYGKYFVIENYELNPMWQKHISQKKWFNPKHVLGVITFTVLFFASFEYVDLPEPFVQFTLGCLLFSFRMINGRHLSNILIFQYVIRNPHEISGKITMAQSAILYTTTFQFVVVLVPLLLIAIFSPSPFVFGSLVSVGLLILAHLKWNRMNRKKC